MKIYNLLFFLQLLVCSCEDESMMTKSQSIDGTWQVIEMRMNNEMKTPDLSGTNTTDSDISITIPNALAGNISGKTFLNTIWFEYKIEEDNKVTFTNYGGTRIAEDEWGIAFRENILNVSQFYIGNDTLFFKNEKGLDIIKLIIKSE